MLKGKLVSGSKKMPLGSLKLQNFDTDIPELNREKTTGSWNEVGQ